MELGIRKIERHYEEKDLEEDIKFARSHLQYPVHQLLHVLQ